MDLNTENKNNFSMFSFSINTIQWHTHKYYKNTVNFFSVWLCVSEKSYFILKNKKQWPNSGIMYSIPKLCIQNNLANTTKYENEYFFLYSNSRFEYRIQNIKEKVSFLLIEHLNILVKINVSNANDQPNAVAKI